jgi:hypothetical protein
MSDTAGHGTAPEAQRQNVQPTGMTAWVGLVAFAGAMMLLLGLFHLVEGFLALFRDEYYQVGASRLTVHVDWAAWGWVHIIGGVAIMAAGIGLFTGKLWARVAAVLLAMISAIINIGFLAAYPVYGVLMVGLDVLIIWAVTVHGGELRE